MRGDGARRRAGRGCAHSKLNENQTAILAELAAAGGRLGVTALRESEALRARAFRRRHCDAGQARAGPNRRSRGGFSPWRIACKWQEVCARAHAERGADGGAVVDCSRHDAGRISSAAAVRRHRFGKTAVYVAAMQRALDAGKSALLLCGDWPYAAMQADVCAFAKRWQCCTRLDARRTCRAVASHSARRGAHRHRYALAVLRRW